MKFLKLKKRLLIAFFILIVVPIFLITAASGVILNYQINSIRQVYDVESKNIQDITNPLQILNRVTRGVYNDIKLNALKTPERFEDSQYILELNERLSKKYSFIVLRKDGEYIYTGDKKQLENIKSSLPEFGIYNTDIDGGLYIAGQNPYLLKQQDFYYSDGSEGSIFIVTDVETVVPQFRASIIQMVISFLIIICLTAFALTFWIYHSILRPLNTLRIATRNIKDGNLNFSIINTSEDEIGQLCEDFEDMRIRLMELIEVRMQYEIDSKELISNISHDLKTPLTAIKGYTEGILDGVADTPEKMDKYLKTIYTKANDMTALVDELAIYSKIDCNEMPFNFVNINLDEYFNDCIEEISLDLEVKKIDIAYFNYTDTSLMVTIDTEQMKRVINNIIGNSSKYMGNKKGIINIRIKDIGDYVQIEFEDNGKGIADKDIPLIFDRFYRTDASRNSSKGGSGLGLSIVKKIIEEHSGRIWVTSKENVGTVIYFTLKKVIKTEET